MAGAMVLAFMVIGQWAPVSAATATVQIANGGLVPGQLTVAVGTSVTWVNNEGNKHRMRSTSGPAEFDSGGMDPGQSFSFVFSVIGTYQYRDEENKDLSNYWGTVVVASGAPSPQPTPVPGASPTPVPASAAQVHMAGRAFSPPILNVDAGTLVTFLNDDGRDHTATARDGSFDSGILNSGGTFVRTFSTPGTFLYFCLIHPDMTGTIAVGGAGGATPPPAASPTPTATPAPPPPGSTSVAIVDFGYTPASLTEPVGTTVSWTNRGVALHTVTASDGSFDSGFVTAGGSYSHTFGTPGTFLYICAIHPNMQGTIQIVSATGSIPPAASPTPTPTSAAPPPGSTSVAIVDFDYTPVTITGPAGTIVQWTNRGVALHTVTASDGSFDSGFIASGGSYSRAFGTPGTYRYICAIHPNMVGTIQIVTASGAIPPPVGPAPAGPLKPVPPGRLIIADFAFRPSTITAQPGTTLVWQNTGVAPHTVTSRAGLFDSRIIPSGGTYSHTFATPGTYQFLCSIHPDMTGTVLVPGPGGSLPPPQAPPPQPPPSVAGDIQMVDFGFTPAILRVPLGTTIRWVNVGVAPHTATARDGSFDSGFLETGDHFDRTFSTPTIIEYICAIHPNMLGVVVVTDAAGDAPSGESTKPSPGDAGATAPEGSASVDMADFLFRPGSLSISGGTSVVFRNVGAALHTATAQGGAWDTGFLQPGGSVALRFDVPGTYAYTCVIHPAMVGTIEVGPAAGLLSPTAAPAAAAPGPTGAIPVQPSSGLVPIDWIKGALALFLVAGAIGFFVRIIAGTPRRSA